MPEREASGYRIIDANLNRLREALRVVEEYARLVREDKALTLRFSGMRHAVQEIETAAGRRALLAGRDTGDDPLASGVRQEELGRQGLADVVSANLKRGQEAARVLEEYLKATDGRGAVDTAKRIRFELYAVEKELALSAG